MKDKVFRTAQKSLLVVFLSVLMLGCDQIREPEIYQWRGTHRDGHYNESNLLSQWKEGGPDMLWMIEGIGLGYAAPVVTKDKLFVNGEIDSISYLFAYDLAGQLLWKTPNRREFFGEGFSGTFPGARTTPTVIGDLVYSCSGKGRIICCDVESGDVKWAVDMITDLGGYQPYFGVAESQAIDDKYVYCYPSGKEINLAALDRFTGEKVWTSGALGDTASFCSPIFIDLPDRKVLVTMSHYFLFAFDCSDGKVVWKYSIEGYEAEGDHCNTPVYYNQAIYQIFGDRNSQGAVRLDLSSDGLSVSEKWRNVPLKNNFNGFVIHDNHLFTTVRGNYLKSVDLETGAVVDSVNVATGSLIYGDDKFICYGTNGQVSLVNYQDGAFKIGGTFKVEAGNNHHFSHPVLANRVMYIRHGNALLAYKIAE